MLPGGGRRLRVVGVAGRGVVHPRGPISDRAGRPGGKWWWVFEALSQRYEIVAVVEPPPQPLRRLRHRARRLLRLPDRPASRFLEATAALEPSLAALDGSYDLILQLQTVLAPGTAFRERPYAVYTDNTLAVTLRQHPGWPQARPGEVSRWLELEAEVARHARAVLAMSEVARRSMVEDYGCPPGRVRAVGSGTWEIEPDLSGRRWDNQAALFVGIDLEVKGWSVLRRAWTRVKAELPSAELWVVGPRLRRPSREGIRWLGRIRDRGRLAELRRQASVLVLSSHFEGWPNVLNEAMGSGLPCIATAVGGVPDVVVAGETGLLVPPGSPEPLAQALVELLADPDLAERMGRAGHARARALFSPSQVVERMAPLLDEGAR